MIKEEKKEIVKDLLKAVQDSCESLLDEDECMFANPILLVQYATLLIAAKYEETRENS